MLSTWIFVGLIALTAIGLSLVEEKLIPFDGFSVSWWSIAGYALVLSTAWIAYWSLI